MSSMPVSNLFLVVAFFVLVALPLLLAIVLGILAIIVEKESLPKASLACALISTAGILIIQILQTFLA